MHKIINFLLLPFAIVGVVVVRILHPFVPIRLGRLHSDRIGHFAGSPERYLCERDLGMHNHRTLDLFYHSLPISNYQLKKMWDRVLPGLRFWRILSLVERINRIFPGSEKYHLSLENQNWPYGIYSRVKAHLYFTAKEEARGKDELKKIGIAEDVPFVCFHHRDSAYLKRTHAAYDWSYHDYRDTSVKNYLAMAEDLTQRGYFVLRMGALVQEPLETNNPKIIDYPNKYRTDFLDIYLSAKCRFFIGTGSGIDEVPKIFRRPVLYVNFIPLDVVEVLNALRLFIPRKLRLKKEGRLLTFREILDSGLGKFFFSAEYEKANIEIIDNTPEEIKGVVVEMDERLKGTWQATPEDEELQQRFWQVFKSEKIRDKNIARIGTEFLRQNRQLLD